MFRKIALASVSLVGLLLALGSAAYVMNPAPAVRAIPRAELAANPSKPFVVKLHAQWCVVCLATKDVWSEIERAYSNRVNLVVLDFTTDAKADASRGEATRLGLAKVFDEYAGITGAILVLDGRTRDVRADLAGNRNVAEYRAAIDAALQGRREVGDAGR